MSLCLRRVRKNSAGRTGATQRAAPRLRVAEGHGHTAKLLRRREAASLALCGRRARSNDRRAPGRACRAGRARAGRAVGV